MRLAPLLLATLLPAVTFAQEADASAPAEAPTAAPVAYTLSPAKSDLYVVIRNDTSAMASRLGHDHVIYASDFSGTVTWPSAAGQACAVDIQVPVLSLTVDPPGLRAKAGLDDNTIDEDDKQSLKKNMYSKSQLAVPEFNAVTFRATACEGTTGKVKVRGDLTVRGTTVPVALTMDVQADASGFSAKGRVTLTHTAFGFKPFAATAFGPRNADDLLFVVHVKGVPKS